MEITPHVEAVRADLEAVASGDEQALATAERLARALEPSLQLRLLDALGQAALELSGQMPSGHVEVRLAGRDVQLVYVSEQGESAARTEDEEGGTARLTLRMPEALKVRVEEASAREALSVNAWLVRAISRGVQSRTFEIEIGKTRSGRRITGYAQS